MSLMVAMCVGLGAPVAAADADRYQLRMGLGGDCIGVNGPPRSKGLFTVRAPGGELRARLRYNTRALGQHVLCPGSIGGGDRLRVRADDGWQRRWRVPGIRIHIDRQRDLVTGATDPGRSVAVEIWDVRPMSGHIGPVHGPFKRIVADDGTFRLDLSDVTDLRGQDGVVVQTDRRGLDVVAIIGVPYLGVRRDGADVYGAGPPGQTVTVRLVRDGQVHATARTRTEPTGSFYAAFRNERGEAVHPRPGDRIRIAPEGPGVRVPRSRLRADARSDSVSGRCMPDTR